jgi:hypothetical protein
MVANGTDSHELLDTEGQEDHAPQRRGIATHHHRGILINPASS